MELIHLIIGALVILGLGLWIYEWRRGRSLKVEDTAHDASTHASREQTRITDEIRNRRMFSGDHHQ